MHSKPFAAFKAGFALSALIMLGGAVSGIGTGKLVAGPMEQQETVAKRLTKAQCLRKPGYIWIEQTKRCVRDTRGSH